MKQCSKCKEWKNESEFNIDNGRKSGIRSACRKCDRKKRKQWRKENPEKVKENNKKYEGCRKKWRKRNPEKVKEHNKRYHEKYPEKRKEKVKKWKKNNPEKVKRYLQKCYEKRINSVEYKEKIFLKSLQREIEKQINLRMKELAEEKRQKGITERQIERKKKSKELKAYKEKYPEEYKKVLKEKHQKWYKKNREEIIKRRKKIHEANPEIRRERKRKYRKKYPEKERIKKIRERARKNNADGSFTVQEWKDMKKKYDYTCPCCKRKEPEIKLTIDHEIPLIKNGSNYISNIQPLCSRCNSVKGSKIVSIEELRLLI